MGVLLDTHVLLWAVLNDPRLSDAQARAITESDVYLSAASVWEIGIKRALGKLDVPEHGLFGLYQIERCEGVLPHL